MRNCPIRGLTEFLVEVSGPALAPDWGRVLGLLRGWMAKFNVVPGVGQLVFNCKMTVGIQYNRIGPIEIHDGVTISYGCLQDSQDWMRIERYFVDTQRCLMKFLLNDYYEQGEEIPEKRIWNNAPKRTSLDFGCACGNENCQGVRKFRTQNVCAFV